MVLAAGAGRRLESLTDDLPKTLLPVDGDRTILDIALGNLRRAGMDTVVVVTGYAAERIEERREGLEQRHDVKVETVFNPKAEEWNNCYSLWCAREHFGRGVLLCNGDTVHPPEVEERLLAARGSADLVLALDDAKPLAEEEMKVLLDGDGLMRGINKAHDPAAAAGEYIGLTLIEPSAAEPLAGALEADVAARPVALLRGRLPGVRGPRRARRGGVGRRARVGRGRRPGRPGQGAGGGVALLSRMVGAPLTIDIGAGAVAGLAPLLADRRISSGGHVAIAVGPGQGEEIAEVLRPQLANADIWMVEGGSVEAATELRGRLRSGFFDAVVGIGGGKTLDTAKHAASLSGLPMVAVATSLAHDGIASPVSSLEEAGRKASFGVQMPIAVVVDLDYVRASEPSMRRSGIGDVVSNLGAIADWWLAAEERGEPVDGLAVTFARTAATSILHREDGIDDDDFLIALAEALVLSGMAMVAAGSSRPCSGGDHEILHAIDHLYPGTAHHGELAGVGSLFTSWLRGDAKMARDIDACLTRHGLPRTFSDLGLDADRFARAVVEAPGTRPDRYTILEHLDLSEEEVVSRVRAFAEAYDR